MRKHNDDTIKTSDTILWKNIPLTLLKGLCVRGSRRPNRTATYWPPLLWPQQRSPGLLKLGPWGPASLGAGFLYHLLPSNCLNLPCTELYNSSTPTFLWASQIALIQPVHGQGYILIFLGPDALVIYTSAFPILIARPGRKSIYNIERLVKSGVRKKLEYSKWAAPTVYVKKKSKEIHVWANFSTGLNTTERF